MEKPKKLRLNRRGFLKGAAAGAAALVTPAPIVNAQETAQVQRGTAAAPTARAIAAETQPVVAAVDEMTVSNPGSDFMLDVLKSLGFDYIAANPGSSLRGLHESITTYAGHKTPQLRTC